MNFQSVELNTSEVIGMCLSFIYLFSSAAHTHAQSMTNDVNVNTVKSLFKIDTWEIFVKCTQN